MAPQIQVDTVTTFSYSDSKRYGYVLNFLIPTVISEDGRYYEVAKEIRSDRQLFGSPLNIRKPISQAPFGSLTGPTVPGQPGPIITYSYANDGFSDQGRADQAATIERDASATILAEVASLNAQVVQPILQTYYFP
jgi:hypothetical protein